MGLFTVSIIASDSGSSWQLVQACEALGAKQLAKFVADAPLSAGMVVINRLVATGKRTVHAVAQAVEKFCTGHGTCTCTMAGQLVGKASEPTWSTWVVSACCVFGRCNNFMTGISHHTAAAVTAQS
jgi:hypothetical protein